MNTYLKQSCPCTTGKARVVASRAVPRRYKFLCTNAFLKKHLHALLRRPWVFSRTLGCGARTGPACTPRRKFGSRESSVARALGVQSREIWQVIEAFRGARADQGSGKPTSQLFCSTAVKALYFVAATVQQRSHIKFVWTTTRVWTLHTRVSAVRVLRYVWVCVGV